MSKDNVLRFLSALKASPAMLAGYNERNLSQLVFHAKNAGFDFTKEELAEAVGKLEASVVLTKDRDRFDGTSRLWRQMWGRRHLEYVVEQVVARHSDEELRSVIGTDGTVAA